MNETVSAQSELHYTDLNIAYLCALSINNILKIMTSKNQKKKKKIVIVVLQGAFSKPLVGSTSFHLKAKPYKSINLLFSRYLCISFFIYNINLCIICVFHFSTPPFYMFMSSQ